MHGTRQVEESDVVARISESSVLRFHKGPRSSVKMCLARFKMHSPLDLEPRLDFPPSLDARLVLLDPNRVLLPCCQLRWLVLAPSVPRPSVCLIWALHNPPSLYSLPKVYASWGWVREGVPSWGLPMPSDQDGGG